MKFSFMKKKTVPAFLKGILYNRVLLYFILFLSIINMTATALLGDFATPLVFILVGVITSYFNKNMLIILTVSLVLSNIFKYGNKMSDKEGLTTKDETEEKPEETTMDKEESKPTKPKPKKETEEPTMEKEESKPIKPKPKKETVVEEETFQDFFETQENIKKNISNIDDQINQANQALETMKKMISKI